MALVLALVLLALGLAVGAAIGGNLLRATMLLRQQSASTRVMALLDGGMAQALAELSVSSAWPGTELGLAAGTVRIASTSVPGVFGQRRVELEARYRGQVRRVIAIVRIRPMAAPEVIAWMPVLASSGAPTSP